MILSKIEQSRTKSGQNEQRPTKSNMTSKVKQSQTKPNKVEPFPVKSIKVKNPHRSTNKLKNGHLLIQKVEKKTLFVRFGQRAPHLSNLTAPEFHG